jgi:hypothetical protein
VLVYGNRLWILGGAASSEHPDRVPTRMLADVWQSADGKTWRQVTNRAPWSGSYNAVVFKAACGSSAVAVCGTR